jgi:hypothetical protein
MVKIASLWKRQGKNGEFLAGKLSDGVSIMIFPNRKKAAPNQPDFEMVIVEDKPRGQAPAPPKPKIVPRKQIPQMEALSDEDQWCGY